MDVFWSHFGGGSACVSNIHVRPPQLWAADTTQPQLSAVKPAHLFPFILPAAGFLLGVSCGGGGDTTAMGPEGAGGTLEGVNKEAH